MKLDLNIGSLVIYLLVVLYTLPMCWSTRWLWIAYSDDKDPLHRPSDCYRRKWIEGRQKNACKRNFDMMQSIKIGARESIDQCQKQFAGRRWNCTVVKKGNVFGKILNFGTRESAFVHALSAAGLAYSVTKTCSSGQLDRCGCDITNNKKFDYQLQNVVRRTVPNQHPNRDFYYNSNNFHQQQQQHNIPQQPLNRHQQRYTQPLKHNNNNNQQKQQRFNNHHPQPVLPPLPPPSTSLLQQQQQQQPQSSHKRVDIQWNGCSDNADFGTAISRVFVNARENITGRNPMRALINLHNNNAGLKAVEESVRVKCKCHGVSGSCESKTCWRAMSSFEQIATNLRDKFDSAIEVEEKHLTGTKRELVPKLSTLRPPSETDLVYVDPSPDFCLRDKRTGSLGTQFRFCNETYDGMEGCKLMCCGRGFNKRRIIETKQCNCKFYWCCTVRCQTCLVEKEETFCK